MLLTEHHNDQQLFVRRAGATSLTVIDRELTRSCVVTPTQVIENFSARLVSDLDVGATELILQLQPEVVLLGTGERAIFPPPNVLAGFLSKGIGLETMDNAAAARTFNVLAGEGRQVVAVFLLPG